ncbi:hypothetical protein TWF694_005178 [Orbilia ellipsospora]|uniref:Ricin B lectin domain-containing protein n=1 Tax=Orbilia ellipsospora TaxID=2528407 RepID=A0AAV9WUS7_9PEZI
MHDNPNLKDGGYYAIMNGERFHYITSNGSGGFTLEHPKAAYADDQTFKVTIKDKNSQSFSLQSNSNGKYFTISNRAPNGSYVMERNSDSDKNKAVWTPGEEIGGVYNWFFFIHSDGIGPVLDADDNGTVRTKQRPWNGVPLSQIWRFIVVDGNDDAKNTEKRIQRHKQMVKARKDYNK